MYKYTFKLSVGPEVYKSYDNPASWTGCVSMENENEIREQDTF